MYKIILFHSGSYTQLLVSKLTKIQTYCISSVVIIFSVSNYLHVVYLVKLMHCIFVKVRIFLCRYFKKHIGLPNKIMHTRKYMPLMSRPTSLSSIVYIKQNYYFTFRYCHKKRCCPLWRVWNFPRREMKFQ